MWWFQERTVVFNDGDVWNVWDGLDVDGGSGYHSYACSSFYGCGWVS